MLIIKGNNKIKHNIDDKLLYSAHMESGAPRASLRGRSSCSSVTDTTHHLSAHLLWRSSTCTHHAVVVDELQLVVRQDVAPVVHQVQSHLSGGHARLTARPPSAHGEQSSNVQLLLSCGRPWTEEEKENEKCPDYPRRTSANPQHGSRWAEPEQVAPGAAEEPNRANVYFYVLIRQLILQLVEIYSTRVRWAWKKKTRDDFLRWCLLILCKPAIQL